MANYIRKNTRAALFASASAFLALLSGEAAHAQNVNFYCGNVEFQLDTARSTITNRFLSNEPVQWLYDGEWLRWTVTRSNEAFGVNVLNGYFISGGQSADAGCILADKKIRRRTLESCIYRSTSANPTRDPSGTKEARLL